ncbi:MAG: response regulator [Candidatus Omnitrophica bacterium]|nr:response regulator [Candidatus Omnitrophota bacterium]
MKKKIMIIDDEADFASMLKIRIENSGDYEVKAFSEAKDIISHIHKFRPDVILLDLLMPGAGGLDACDMLNNDPLGQSIPVIVVSGLNKETDKIKAFKFGVIDYLVKPVNDLKLMEAIKKAIEYKTEKF